MSFRARLFLAISLALLVPLTVLALGVRREMDRRLGDEARRRGDAAVRSLAAELARERERVDRQVVGARARPHNGQPVPARGHPGGSRLACLRRGSSGAMRLAGLAILVVQDSGGRILSSGHFRNEYDRLSPALPAFLLERAGRPAMVRARTADSSLLALAAAERFTVASRQFSLVGGVGTEDRFLRRLDSDPDLAVRLQAPDSTGELDRSRLVGELSIPFLDQEFARPDSARLVVTRVSETLAALQRGLNAWFLVSLGVLRCSR